MRFQPWLCAVVASAIAPMLASNASASAIVNGGYEAGTAGDADDWAEIVGGPNGTVGRSMTMPNTGDWSALMTVDNLTAPAGGAYFIEQNRPVGSIDGTQNYDLSFSAKVDSTDFTGMDVFFQVLWLDQDGSNGGGVQGEVLTSLVGQGINTGYQAFGLSDYDVPDGADSVLLRFQLSAGAVPGVLNAFYVDDVSLTPTQTIPEPTSIALWALGGVGAFLLRRRFAA